MIEQKPVLVFRLYRGFTSLRKDHREILRCLGFRRRHQVLTFPNTPEVLGAIKKVAYLLVQEKGGSDVS